MLSMYTIEMQARSANDLLATAIAYYQGKRPVTSLDVEAVKGQWRAKVAADPSARPVTLMELAAVEAIERSAEYDAARRIANEEREAAAARKRAS